MLEYAVEIVDKALTNNLLCSSGLLAQKRALGITLGPSGGPEILAFLYADDPHMGYWYAHALRHPKNSENFVSLIVWSDKLVNASNARLFFQRFHYWMKVRLEYHTCSIQNSDDAYEETTSIFNAACSLAEMIRRFDIEKRWPGEEGPYSNSPDELRILNVYGLEESRDENGRYPPAPTITPLFVVRN